MAPNWATILILVLINAQHVAPAEAADENGNELTADAEVKELLLKIEQMAQEMATPIPPSKLIMLIALGLVGFGVFNLLVQHINVVFPRKQNEKRNTVFVGLRYASIVQNCYVATLSLYAFTNQNFSITTIAIATFLCFVGVCLIAWAFYSRCKWWRKFGLKQQLKQINRNFRHILVVYFGIFGVLYRFVGIDNLLAPFIAIVSSLLYALYYYFIARHSIEGEYSKAAHQ